MTEKTLHDAENQETLRLIADAYLVEFEQLADQSAQTGHYSLQDACLLLIEKLNDLPEETIALSELLDTLSVWPQLVEDYQANPMMVSEEIVKFLRNPLLNLPLTDDEFEMLEIQLTSDTIIELDNPPSVDQPATATASRSLAEYSAELESLAEQAAEHGNYGLQDACLLLQEKVSELSEGTDETVSILALLDSWPQQVEAYRQAPLAGSAEIISFLHHPQLQLPLTDDEFALLAEQLAPASDTVASNALPLSVDDIFYDDASAENTAEQVQSLIEEAPATFESTLEPFDASEFTATAAAPAAGITLTQCAAELERFANTAAQNACYGLQDACLLLLDRLGELSEDSEQSNQLLSLLTHWPAQIESYYGNPSQNSSQIIAFLKQPALQLPLTDDEFAMLEEQLLQDAEHNQPAVTETHEPAVSTTATQSAEDWLTQLQQQADQAAQENNYGLQDACLLLLDQLTGLTANTEPAQRFLSALNDWPSVIASYDSNPRQNSALVIEFLKQPDLQLPLTADEFVMLEDQLQVGEGSAEKPAAVQTGIVPEISAAPAAPSVTTADASQQNAIRAAINQLQQQADQAAQEGNYGLQDACLLLLDRLENPPETAEQIDRLLVILAGWAVRLEAYYRNPRISSIHIIKFLRQPELQLPLTGDEFALLEEQLMAGNPPAAAEAEEPITAEPVVQAVTAPTTADLVQPEAEPDETVPLRSNLASLPHNVRELLELLVMQTDLIDGSLTAVSLSDSDAVTHALQDVADKVECFMMAARTVGFEGLALVGEHVVSNINHFQQHLPEFNELQLKLLHRWLYQLKAYLLIFNENDASHSMLAQLAATDWPQPLNSEASALVYAQLQAASKIVLSTQAEPAREKVATAADISLKLPDDVNQELLEILLQELPQQTQQFSQTIQRIKNGGSLQDVDVAQRVAHTLKGSANTVGIKGIATLTHQLEDILLICAKEHQLPGGALCETLMNAADCLEAMSETLLGMSEAPDDALTVLQEVLDWANRIEREGLSTVNTQAASTQRPKPTDAAPAEKESAEGGENAAAAEKAQAATVRITVEQVDNLFRLSSESIILNGQVNERLNQMKAQLQAMETQFALLQQLGAELDQLIDLKDLSGRSSSAAQHDFDALEMDQYNELHTASRRMVEAAVDAREISHDIRKELEQMNEVTEYQQRLVIDTQEAVMQTRLVPVVSIVPRLQRGMRQTCRLTGKEADLNITGQDLLIDGDTLNAIVEPLMHAMRNAVDHGIESSEDRAAKGKSRTGKVTIAFDREGNNILIRCMDDGKGLDFSAIRETAEKRGLLQAGQEVSEDELKRFILRPNFSTRTETTQTSGRGVGMDVVRVQVAQMGGHLTLDSIFGQGLTVEMRVPLPLSRSHALLAQVARYRVAIASKGLSQILYADDGELKTIGQELVLMLDGNIYPAVRLDNLLHVADSRHSTNHRSHGAILLVNTEDKTTAVLVDAITDNRDVVIKSLGHYITKIQGFIGATILGDGAVVPVLDIPELLRSPLQAAAAFDSGDAHEMAEPQQSLPTILVVDDSLSNRRALEQLLNDGGYKVRTARDGIEAAELISNIKPALVLTDLEMPRMNGIELTAHIRTQTTTRHLPVIMITSRSTQKHRQLAEEAGVNFYLTKPVREDDLFSKVQMLMTSQAAGAGA